jgi:hypothetical protein
LTRFQNTELDLELVISKERGKTIFFCPEPNFVDVLGAQESIPPDFVAWSAGMTNSVIIAARQAT